MKTFTTAVFLMLAATASGRDFKPYKQHAATVGDVEEVPLFGAMELFTASKSDKEEKKEKKEKKDKSDKKEKSKKSKDDKDDKKSKSKDSKDKSSKDSKDKSSKDSKDKSSKSSSNSKSKRNNSSSSSSSSSSGSKSKNGRGNRKYNNLSYREDMCDCNMKPEDFDDCNDLWNDVCKKSLKPSDATEDFCEYLGIYDCRSSSSEDGRANLRGKVVIE
mmetsp:Transcript_11797/g.20513  ORF Transcript_11797/g.20513 Transcript_11797/m.20513 type:complete len:217 (-) Transcript_11797:194-844(-)|eukprot:CAMPEP_0183703054 /NCGR_PEP_ID=MMETSP0737-20130205/944_1 /TAXON_ID=385413 /ORGANISM="Thalassiosira miniscula, Strain CCMP1093" /LENGTH=216 /DNA_ID=CAMNT_0025929753 /DNA_START=67 /DNA_END=717 /DNA_ORIENTATION=-